MPPRGRAKPAKRPAAAAEAPEQRKQQRTPQTPFEASRHTAQTYEVDCIKGIRYLQGMRQYLGTPASSASAERLFSIAGRIYDDLRQHMQDPMLEALMWARINREGRTCVNAAKK